MQAEQVEQEAASWYETINWQGVVDRVADGLGTTGEYLWEVLVQGTIISGIASLIAFCLVALLGLIMGIYGYRSLRGMPWKENTHTERTHYSSGNWAMETWLQFWFTGIVPLFVSLILTAVFLGNLKGCIMEIGAPEYEALRFLISQARQ
jgi:NADH:ubiquinone oxidoreductase subunit 3 (subunit A)